MEAECSHNLAPLRSAASRQLSRCLYTLFTVPSNDAGNNGNDVKQVAAEALKMAIQSCHGNMGWFGVFFQNHIFFTDQQCFNSQVGVYSLLLENELGLSLIHISEPTRQYATSRMPSSA